MATFRDRKEAGERLAAELEKFAGEPNAIVLGLPRGGVPVGYEVARRLQLPLDVFVVRKLGVPGHEELAMGAVASGGGRVLNQEVLRHAGVSDEMIEETAKREMQELKRREAEFRPDRPAPSLRGKTVILVDDGVATGSTMIAAIEAIQQQEPERVVVAVPTVAADTLSSLESRADEVIALMAPESFMAVGQWYENFGQTTDREVKEILHHAQKAA